MVGVSGFRILGFRASLAEPALQWNHIPGGSGHLVSGSNVDLLQVP